jgi:hypothetical protein
MQVKKNKLMNDGFSMGIGVLSWMANPRSISLITTTDSEQQTTISFNSNRRSSCLMLSPEISGAIGVGLIDTIV